MKVEDINKMTVKELNTSIIGIKAQDEAQDKVIMKIIEFCKQEKIFLK